MPRYVELRFQHGDIGDIGADVAVLKYAQAFHGADRQVATALERVGVAATEVQPQVGEHRYVATKDAIRAPHALFMGVVPIHEFAYQQIRTFAHEALGVLVAEAPGARHVALTMHGPGYGLDETEAFLSEFAGLLDALQGGRTPRSLEHITVVDRS